MNDNTSLGNQPKRSIAFLAGLEAKKSKVPLKKSAIKNLMVGSKQYFDFLDGYDYKENKK